MFTNFSSKTFIYKFNIYTSLQEKEGEICPNETQIKRECQSCCTFDVVHSAESCCL